MFDNYHMFAITVSHESGTALKEVLQHDFNHRQEVLNEGGPVKLPGKVHSTAVRTVLDRNIVSHMTADDRSPML